MTNGDRFKQQLEESIFILNELSKRDFKLEELKDTISSIGTKFELYIKSCVFPLISSRKNLIVFIDELLKYGFVKDEVDLLHCFRKEYNNSKHEPSYRPSVIDIIILLNKVLVIVEKLIGIGLGQSNDIIRSRYRRVYWIAAWDHYDGGDTEIHISLPDESGKWLGPPSIDMIYIDLVSWELVKKELSNIGTLKESKNLIPDKLLKEWSNEGEFLDALVFEGYYKDLMFVLSQHEKRIELMPGLMRHHNLRSMVQACILSLIDVIDYTNINDKVALLRDVKKQAISVYAIPENYDKFILIIESFVNMIHEVEPSKRQLISEIKWLSSEDYEEGLKSAIAVNQQFKVFLDNNITFCIIGN